MSHLCVRVLETDTLIYHKDTPSSCRTIIKSVLGRFFLIESGHTHKRHYVVSSNNTIDIMAEMRKRGWE